MDYNGIRPEENFKKKFRSFLENLKERIILVTGRPEKGFSDLSADFTQKSKFLGISPRYDQSSSVAVDFEKAFRNRCICLTPESPITEAYKILRTQVLHRTRGGCTGKTIMITSAQPNEGKTLTAINLALTLSREFNQTALLVDCDLRQQKVHEYLGVSSPYGIIDYLVHDVPIQEIMIWPGIEKFTFISGGDPVLESTEYLSSTKMKELVEEMKGRYKDRYIIFDIPPVLSMADAQAFAPLVDFIILVVESHKTSRQDVAKIISLLPREKILGIVFNKHTGSRNPYPYYHYRRRIKRFSKRKRQDRL